MRSYMGSLFWQVLFWVAVVGLIFVSIVSIPVQHVVTFQDKVFHFLAYFLVTVLGCLAYPQGRYLIWKGVILILLGVALEGVQAFLPDRYAEFWDFVANSAGVVVGTLLFVWLASGKSDQKPVL